VAGEGGNNPDGGGGLSKSNFIFGVMAMPGATRSAVKAVYDFCRITDDDVDLNPAQAPARLAEWRVELEKTWREMPTRPVTRALLPYIKKHNFRREYFEKILDGYEMDVSGRRYQNLDELVAYCDCVAGAVGLLIIQALGVHDEPGAKEYSRNLAIGFQLTNILRDISEDLDRGRIYIPAEDFGSAGYPEADFRARKASKEYFLLFHYEAARIRNYFRLAEKAASVGGLNRRLLGPEIMRATYEDLLARMEKIPDNVLHGEFKGIPLGERFLIAFSRWLQVNLGW
jgi:phytoene synthase